MNLSCIYNKKYLIFREVSTMPINKNEITKEMFEKAMQCNTAEDLIALAKTEGVELTKEEAECELKDGDLKHVAGGRWKSCGTHTEESRY